MQYKQIGFRNITFRLIKQTETDSEKKEKKRARVQNVYLQDNTFILFYSALAEKTVVVHWQFHADIREYLLLLNHFLKEIFT